MCPSGDPPNPSEIPGAGVLPAYITTGKLPRDQPATPLPPSCLPVIERGLSLAFPSHLLATTNRYITPSSSHMADDLLAGRNGNVVSDYTSPHIGAKLIQIFEAVPSGIVHEFHAAAEREDRERARMEKERRDQGRYAANKRGVVDRGATQAEGGVKKKGNKPSATRSNASATSANSGGSASVLLSLTSPPPPLPVAVWQGLMMGLPPQCRPHIAQRTLQQVQGRGTTRMTTILRI